MMKIKVVHPCGQVQDVSLPNNCSSLQDNERRRMLYLFASKITRIARRRHAARRATRVRSSHLAPVRLFVLQRVIRYMDWTYCLVQYMP